MNTLTIRTLGLPWLMALALTGMALLAFAAQELLPPGAWRVWGDAASPVISARMSTPVGAGAAASLRAPNPADATLSTAELFGALTAREHSAMREQITAIRALLTPPAGDPDGLAISQARARLAALVAAQDQPGSDAQPALVLTSLLSRIDTAMAALHQAGSQIAPVITPVMSDDLLAKVATSLAIIAALFALMSGPLALSPGRKLSVSLIQMGQEATNGGHQGRSYAKRLWGIDRRDSWGALARQVAAAQDAVPAPQQAALSAPADQLRETAEAMSRLLLDSGQELTRMRGEAGEAVNNAVMLGARLADAVLDAESRLEARVSRGLPGRDLNVDALQQGISPQGGFVDPAALWSAASTHADRLEEAASRALAAATVLPAAAERIENAIAGLDRMAEAVAANTDGLADLAARAGAAAAMLPEAAQRIERAADGLDGVTSRTSSAASMLPQAAQLIAQASAELGRAAEAVANNASGLNDAVARQAEASASLPHVARRIETAVAGLDRTAAALDDATDHARIANRAAAATATVNETNQRALADAAQQMSSLGASLSEQLPALAYQIAEATEGLRGGATTVLVAADRVDGTSRAITALVSGAETAQAAMTGATHYMNAVSEQLPAVAMQIANVATDLDRSADAVARSADRAVDTSRAVGSLTSGVEMAQAALSGAVQRITSLGEELPALAFQIADATAGLDGSVQHLGATVDSHATLLHDAATAAAGSSATQAAVTEVLRQVISQTTEALPTLTSRIADTVERLDRSNAAIETVSTEVSRMGELTLSSQTSLRNTVEGMTALGDKLQTQVPALTTELADQVDELHRQLAAQRDATSAHVQRIEMVSGALEQRASGLDQVTERMSEAAAAATLAQQTAEARQASLAETVRKISNLATSVGESLPPLATRISDAVATLEQSADSLSMIGASAGEALPAAASRIDDVLSGLDSTVQLISEAARTAAASVAESAGTQSALAQTVQCMASVGEALPSLAMRLEGTLGALDRSTDSIVSAANDVAEAGRAISATAAGANDEDGERRATFGPPRPVPDASMRRLQSVASALALAGSGGRG